VTRIIRGEPPTDGDGYVVYPDPALPNYTFGTVAGYWRIKPRLPVELRGPFAGVELLVDRAIKLARPLDHNVWVVASTGG
jgi:hypothetical protein